jgi:hypothetical protein
VPFDPVSEIMIPPLLKLSSFTPAGFRNSLSGSKPVVSMSRDATVPELAGHEDLSAGASPTLKAKEEWEDSLCVLPKLAGHQDLILERRQSRR